LTQHLVNVVELYSGYALCMLHYLTALTYENGNLHTINAVSVQRRIACAHVSIRLLFHGCQTTRYDRESFFGNRRSSVGPWQWGAGNINVKEPQRWSSPFAKESHMAQLLVAIVLLSSVLLFGCSSNLGSVGLGAVGGAAAGAVGRGL
jgi:hypothetical protein